MEQTLKQLIAVLAPIIILLIIGWAILWITIKIIKNANK